ncbi:MAG: Uncharacterized peptidase YqjE, partial [uncultured Solirubrobacterales bacterium]
DRFGRGVRDPAGAAAPERGLRPTVRDREPVATRARRRRRAHRRAARDRARGRGGRERRRDRRRCGKPARAGSGHRRGGAGHPALRAHGHRPPRCAGRGRARGWLFAQPPRGHPRGRQQGGGGDHARGRPAARGRARAGVGRAAVHHLRGAGPPRGQGLRPLAAARQARLRLRPRLSDRRAHPGRADLLRHRGAPPRPVGPRRAAPGSRAQRGGGCGERDHPSAARAPRRGDDGQRRAHRRRGGGQRRTRALSRGARGPQPRPRARRGAGHRDRRRPHRRRDGGRVRSRDRGPRGFPRLSPDPHRRAGCDSRSRARRPRHRTGLLQHRLGQRRRGVQRRRPALPQPRRRQRGQPPPRRAGQRRGARDRPRPRARDRRSQRL